jgi:hypothetical protein
MDTSGFEVSNPERAEYEAAVLTSVSRARRLIAGTNYLFQCLTACCNMACSFKIKPKCVAHIYAQEENITQSVILML